jgi:hypothetical protein
VQTSLFLARLIGPVALALGVSMLIGGGAYRLLADEFLRSRAMMYLTGLLTMLGGLAVVLTHNVWVADWRVIITLLGWLAAIGGALRMIVPQFSQSLGTWFMARPMALTGGALFWIALGLVLSFFGYVR